MSGGPRSDGPEGYYGLYPALVINILDPLRIGRIQVQVPWLGADGEGVSSWATLLTRIDAEEGLMPPDGAVMVNAVDIFKSGTRKEELLIDKNDLSKIWILRKFLNDKPLMEAMEFLLEKLSKAKTNAQFLKSMNS